MDFILQPGIKNWGLSIFHRNQHAIKGEDNCETKCLKGTDVHTWTKAQRRGSIQTQGSVESMWWCNSSDWSQLSLGKHAESLALITEALNLSSATHTMEHEYTNWSIETISPRRLRHDWNTNSHSGHTYSKMGGFWERTASSASKTNMETAGPASIVIADRKNVIRHRKRRNKKAKLQGTLKAFTWICLAVWLYGLKCVLWRRQQVGKCVL